MKHPYYSTQFPFALCFHKIIISPIRRWGVIIVRMFVSFRIIIWRINLKINKYFIKKSPKIEKIFNFGRYLELKSGLSNEILRQVEYCDLLLWFVKIVSSIGWLLMRYSFISISAIFPASKFRITLKGTIIPETSL